MCKNSLKIIISLIISLSCFTNAFAHNSDITMGERISEYQKNRKLHIERPKYAPLIALGEVVLINVVVHSFDRFVLNEHYAQVSVSDIKKNFSKGFVWDNDDFSMNTFFHPYHGSLYYNSARANGLSFWQSVPYAFAGSFMWEFFGENSDPSINDFINTSIGGIALGEMMHRVSYLVLDDSSSGWERAGREILAGLISPMDLFNRLINGKTRHRSFIEEKEREQLNEKFHISLSIFNRYMTDLDNNHDRSNLALGFTAFYGEPFADKEERQPYDFFIADVNFNVIGNQPAVIEASIIGSLWGKQWDKKANSYFAGVFQHFDYYNSNSFSSNGPIPYEFAAPASFGGGFYIRRQKDESKLPVFLGSFHVNFVLLGASESDHYSVYKRDYNFGTGYSLNLTSLVNLSRHFSAFINAKAFQVFTLHNEVDDDYDSVYDEYNVPGNNGNTLFGLLSAGLGYKINDDVSIIAEQRFFSRKSHYKSFKDVSTNSMETRLKLTYSLFN